MFYKHCPFNANRISWGDSWAATIKQKFEDFFSTQLVLLYTANGLIVFILIFNSSTSIMHVIVPMAINRYSPYCKKNCDASILFQCK